MAFTKLTRQNGPFKYDAYLGFSVYDMHLVHSLREKLEQRGISCYPKYDPAFFMQSVQTAIREGVACSQKCLLYVSQSFIEDQWYTFEVAEVLNKVKRFSRDMLIVLKDPYLVAMPPDLSWYTELAADISTFENPGALDCLALALKKEPSPSLTVMPKENVGCGSAFGYFYGYLRLVLPEFQKRLEEDTLAGSPELLQRTVRKMLIIMPESCFCPPQFSEDGKIEHTNKFVVRVAHRAGNVHRDYKSSFYKIIDQTSGEEYYFVGELATPLLTLYETYHFGLAGMTRDQLYTERDCFYFTLNAILSHPNNRECNGQFKLLYWDNDPGMNDENPKQFYDFILPEIKAELNTKTAENNVKGDGHGGDDGGSHLESDSAGSEVPTFVDVPVNGPTPAAIYETLSHYPMKSDPRGRCLIINMSNFDKGELSLNPRVGADEDIAILQQLFTDLKFCVEVHQDLTMATLEMLLLTVSAVDHSNYDAFVCCLLTHGKLGVLYTSDAKPIRILDIVKYFDDIHCESLRGKPKMFFIQACLTGTDSNGSPTNSRSSSPGRTPMERDEVLQQNDTDAAGNTHLPVPVHENGLELVESSTTEMETSALDWDANIVPTLEPASKADTETWAEGRATLVPGRPDFLMSYATLPGQFAYRDRNVGSLYVHQLARNLRQRIEIDRALKMVSRGVAEELKKYDIKDNLSRFRLPFHLTSGMDKLITL